MGNAEIKAIIQNQYSGIQILEGRRMPTRITGQTTLNRLYKPNDPYAHYRADWYELVSTEDLSSVDMRVNNYDPSEISIQPTLTQLWYENSVLVASGEVATTGIIDYKPNSSLNYYATLDSQASVTSIDPEYALDITGYDYIIEGSDGNSYRHVSRWRTPMHLNGASAYGPSTFKITPNENLSSCYFRVSVYDDGHAPLDDNAESERSANYSAGTYNNIQYHVPMNFVFYHNTLSQHIIGSQTFGEYITTKLAIYPIIPEQINTITFSSPPTFKVVYTPDKVYEEQIRITTDPTIYYTMTFNATENCSGYYNGTGFDIISGMNTIVLPQTGIIDLTTSGSGQTTISNITFEGALTDAPYFLQLTNKQFIKNKYYYTLEARYGVN